MSVQSGRQQQVTLPPQSFPVTQRTVASRSVGLFITNLPLEFNGPVDAACGIDIVAMQGLQDHLQRDLFFEGNVLSQNLLEGVAPEINLSDTVTQAMWMNYGHLDDWIQNIALSVLHYFRLNAPATNDSSYYTGTGYSVQPFVRARWAWLAFPAAMVLVSMLFLFATVYRMY